MNFANLTPAERMKASGLIGLIVVVIFFVVYTMMGALGSKKPTTPPRPSNSEPQTSASVPSGPIEGAQGTVVDPSNPFPIPEAKTHQASAQNQDLYKIDDPFTPIRSGKVTPSAAAISAMNGGHAPSVGVVPAGKSLPTYGQSRPSVAPFGMNPFSNGASIRPANLESEKPEPPKYMPAIQVVGVVHGSPSVATLRVEGHVITARPGDLIAKGHRLVTVNDEGVVIRAHGELTSLRVGAGVNNSKEAAQAES